MPGRYPFDYVKPQTNWLARACEPFVGMKWIAKAFESNVQLLDGPLVIYAMDAFLGPFSQWLLNHSSDGVQSPRTDLWCTCQQRWNSYLCFWLFVRAQVLLPQQTCPLCCSNINSKFGRNPSRRNSLEKLLSPNCEVSVKICGNFGTLSSKCNVNFFKNELRFIHSSRSSVARHKSDEWKIQLQMNSFVYSTLTPSIIERLHKFSPAAGRRFPQEGQENR